MLTDFIMNVALIGAEWVLYVLIVLSVIAMAFGFERQRYYRRAYSDHNGLRIAHYHMGPAGLRVALETNLTFLASVGSNAPFIGLFGTVLGIMKAFNDLVGKADGGVDVVMSGISEALVATAVGIFVAIPALATYNAFQRKVEQLMAIAASPAPPGEAEALQSRLTGGAG